ncbi:NF038132 family protein [Sphingomonas arenae]|uniref:NF038132 family protein n=1 Tax=Sphingomonas arenae TaxID=2812555 RepID=UPI001F2EE673|nr:NF038132 family protein [Sphingomonas arenae]
MRNRLRCLLHLAGLFAGASPAAASICIGTCGTLGPNGVVTAPPGGTNYSYVTTNGGVSGAGQLAGFAGTNGSTFTTDVFSAAAGDPLNFFFNYITSDGSGFADYAWARLLTSTGDEVAILFTARTKPSGSIIPGQDLPGVTATLNPASVPIISGGPQWSPLGSYSGLCFGPGCGYTGWVGSTYSIAGAGDYMLQFGVTNFSDTIYHSGMAFSGITVAGNPIGGAVPEPGTWAMMLVGFGAIGFVLRRRRMFSPSPA